MRRIGVKEGDERCLTMNKYIKLFIPVLFGMVGILPAMGQETATGNNEKETQTIKAPMVRLLVIEVDRDNEVTVAASTITSISKHNFMLDGTMLVSEVTIDTTGNNSIRFYCVQEDDAQKILTAKTPQDAARQVTGRATKEIRNGGRRNSDEPSVPSIKFPEGVYAHTIEFQVDSPMILQKIYNGARTVWEVGAAKMVRVKLTSK